MFNPQTSQTYVTLVIIWFVLMFSQVMFIGVVYFNKPEIFTIDTSRPILGDQPLFPLLFAVLAVFDLALAFFMRKRAIDQALEERNVRYLQTGLIVGCALCEAISLLGMFLAFAFNYQYFFVWFALGAVGILLQFPRREHVRMASFKK